MGFATLFDLPVFVFENTPSSLCNEWTALFQPRYGHLTYENVYFLRGFCLLFGKVVNLTKNSENSR